MKKTGIWIHPHELDDIWTEQIITSGLDIVGIHPKGGTREATYNSLNRLLEISETSAYQRMIERMLNAGAELEYSFHAMSYLVPDDVLKANADFCRVGMGGQRLADVNLCPSNKKALEYLSNACYNLAKKLHPTNHRYHIWQDDIMNGKCNCEQCREMSRADQAIIINNAILRGLRAYDSKAVQSHLAYYDTLSLPEHVTPDKGLYLEFAPYQRDFQKPLSDPSCEKNASSIAPIKKLIDYFGTDNATALDYWLDNSLFSGYKLPPKELVLDESVVRQDCVLYRDAGFEYLTVFACYLGADYRELYGMPPFDRFMNVVSC